MGKEWIWVFVPEISFYKPSIGAEEIDVDLPPQTPRRLRLAQHLCRWLPPIMSMRLRSVVYPQKMAFQDDFPFTVKSQTGSQYSGRTSDFHGYPFSVHGYYEWRNWALAAAVCAPGDTIIEIGANVGTETVGFRDIIGDSGKVFAFEPVPANLEALHHLVVLNRWRNVHVQPLALGDAECRLSFVLPPHKHASGVGHLAVGQETNPAQTIEVQCQRLDTLINDIGPAKAIFCDAEGAETMILRGAQEYLGQHKPALVLEASPKLLVRAGSNLVQLHETLHSFNYVAFAVGRFGLSRVVDFKNSNAGNWFCVHNSMIRLARKCSASIARCGLLPCLRGLNPLCR